MVRMARTVRDGRTVVNLGDVALPSNFHVGHFQVVRYPKHYDMTGLK